jgi:hypothetical protein
MLIVTVEHLRWGEARTAHNIGRVAMVNVSGAGAEANYVAAFLDDRPRQGAVWVTHHRRSAGFWPLLQTVTQRIDEQPRRPVPECWEAAAAVLHQRVGPLASQELAPLRSLK